MKIRLLALILLLCMLSVLFVGCSKKEPLKVLSPGTYSFDLKTVNYWAEINWFAEGKNEYDQARTSIYVGGEINCNKVDYAIYNNCYIKVLVKVNGNEFYEKMYLDSSGQGFFDAEISVPATYETKVSYKIVEVDGIVEIPIFDGALIKSDGFYYQLNYSNEEQDYVAIMCDSYFDRDDYIDHDYRDYDGKRVSCDGVEKKNRKKIKRNKATLYLKDYVEYDGQKFRFAPYGFFCFYASYRSIFRSKITTTIILDGDFYMEDIFGLFGPDDASIFAYSDIKALFPNIKNVVIKNVKQRYSNSFIMGNSALLLPETGVNFYINDSTQNEQFTRFIETNYFVNGIFSFDEFDIESYRK